MYDPAMSKMHKTLRGILVLLSLFPALSVSAWGAETLLLQAAKRGRADEVRDLLLQGADPDASSPGGWTPLMEAAVGGRRDVALVLISAHADLDARDRLGRTALDVAERAGQAEVVRLLRSHGARGSGKSLSDTVCVRKWRGSGFCGAIEGIDGTRFLLRVTEVKGCSDAGCEADAECSQGQPVGSGSLGRQIWVRNSCLTATYPGSGR